MLTGAQIVKLHDDRNARWHHAVPHFASSPTDISSAIEQQHLANFELWHEEDKARVADASDAQIATVKRTIDRLNQRRNDLMEQCDVLALAELSKQNLPHPQAALHSESLGLMLDRLSILSLKIFHTQEEIDRDDAPSGHAARNRERLATLNEQRNDLASALDALWADVLTGKRRFKIYRQLKMYNEPSLNPRVYEAQKPR